MVSCVPTVRPVPLAMARPTSSGPERVGSSEDVAAAIGDFMLFEEAICRGGQPRSEAPLSGEPPALANASTSESWRQCSQSMAIMLRAAAQLRLRTLQKMLGRSFQ